MTSSDTSQQFLDGPPEGPRVRQQRRRIVRRRSEIRNGQGLLGDVLSGCVRAQQLAQGRFRLPVELLEADGEALLGEAHNLPGQPDLLAAPGDAEQQTDAASD